MGPKYYITTAIDYANSTPHLGTAYEKIGADVIARYKRLSGFDVRFLMGNDEHSQNVRKKAAELGLDPKAYCDQMAEKFKETWKILGISNDDFIQTTEPRHHATVRAIADLIFKKGYIYKAPYEGHYCVSCEAFYQEKDLLGGLCPNHKTKPEWIREENYFFKLTAFEKELRALLAKPGFLRPEARRNELQNVLEQGLQDVSISRAGTAWGIPLPFDESAVAYVWFDALVNYVSGLGQPKDPSFQKYWPADLHVIGKDITRFHCLIWPAMLIAADLPVPGGVWSHGFISIDGEKMSKSRGNVADPVDLANRYGAEVLRYHLMREVAWDKDGDFSEERLRLRYNADLANDLGNLLSRAVAMAKKYVGEALPAGPLAHYSAIAKDASARLTDYKARMDEHLISLALDEIFAIVALGNAFVGTEQPWTMAKDPANAAKVRECLFLTLDMVRACALALLPVMPEKMAQLLGVLGVAEADFAAQFQDLRLGAVTALRLDLGAPLFPRLEAKA